MHLIPTSCCVLQHLSNYVIILFALQEEMANEMPNVKFAKLNCTTDPNAKKIAMSQGIKALPTFHLFKKNEKVGTFVGGKPSALRKFLDEQVA